MTYLPNAEIGDKYGYPPVKDQVNAVDAAGRRMVPSYIRPSSIIGGEPTDNNENRFQ